MIVRTASEDETVSAARELARRLRPGDVVALEGPLGAGKTVFVRGIAEGLGCEARPTSPTYVLVQRYPGRVPLVHVDLFRVEREADLAAAGVDDAIGDPDCVAAVEWADRFPHVLPRRHVRVAISLEGDARVIEIG